MRANLIVAALIAVAALAAFGCGASDGPQAVSGTVSRQGQPLEHGTVTFLSTTGPAGPVCGALVTNGRFEVPAERGLEPGTYRVAISAPEPGAPLTAAEKNAGASPKARETLPAKYNTATELKAEVRAGEKNQFEFKLE